MESFLCQLKSSGLYKSLLYGLEKEEKRKEREGGRGKERGMRSRERDASAPLSHRIYLDIRGGGGALGLFPLLSQNIILFPRACESFL